MTPDSLVLALKVVVPLDVKGGHVVAVLLPPGAILKHALTDM